MTGVACGTFYVVGKVETSVKVQWWNDIAKSVVFWYIRSLLEYQVFLLIPLIHSLCTYSSIFGWIPQLHRCKVL